MKAETAAGPYRAAASLLMDFEGWPTAPPNESNSGNEAAPDREWPPTDDALCAGGDFQAPATGIKDACGGFSSVPPAAEALAHSDLTMSWGWDAAPLDVDADAIFPGEGICL